ncbi:MAG TPA: hypothetical protein VGM39_18670 [Kofleriaceae bacterium]
MKLLNSTMLCAVVLAAAPAFAMDHEMRVNEVLLSGTDNAASQFVEFQDPGEMFPATYNFVLFDSSGTSIAAQPMIPGTGNMRMVVANDAARTEYHLTTGTDADSHVVIINLQSTLPAAGAVCFRRQSDLVLIHCLGWGNAASFPVGVYGTDHGAAPTAGMSLQRYLQCTLVGPPSPNATNTGTCPLQVDGPPMMVDAMPGDADIANPDADDGDNGDNKGGGGGCTIDVGPGWLGGIGLAGLVIAGGVLRRRRR